MQCCRDRSTARREVRWRFQLVARKIHSGVKAMNIQEGTRERGQILVLFALTLAVLIGLTGMAIDPRMCERWRKTHRGPLTPVHWPE